MEPFSKIYEITTMISINSYNENENEINPTCRTKRKIQLSTKKINNK